MNTLEQIYKDFAEQLRSIADNAILEFINEYVPYAKIDLENNAFYKAEEMVKAYLAGELMPDILKEYKCKDVRDKIYQDHKGEIIKAIGVDKDEEISMLKRRLAALERFA
jgi:DNA-binding ferritin-like protein